MPDLFDTLAARVFAVEGGYTNDPHDSGGVTNHGITERVARENGYTGHMRDLTKAQGLAIYRAKYWARPGFARVAALSPKLAEELLDTGVNCGTGTAAMWLQRCLNVLNRGAVDFPDVTVDGDVGPATLNALGLFLKRRGAEGEGYLLRLLDALQGAHYVELAERRPKDEGFVNGWARTRLGNVKG